MKRLLFLMIFAALAASPLAADLSGWHWADNQIFGVGGGHKWVANGNANAIAVKLHNNVAYQVAGFTIDSSVGRCVMSVVEIVRLIVE